MELMLQLAGSCCHCARTVHLHLHRLFQTVVAVTKQLKVGCMCCDIM